MRKLLLATLFIASPCYSQSINTTSQSTGSVVNQAVQVVPSRQFSYSSGPSIQCQGATLNISPFVARTYSFGLPYEDHYDRPIYDTSDNYGLTDADGNDIGDGIPDNPGRVLYHEKVRTGMQESNTSWNTGITATFSIPLDRRAVNMCHESMAKQNELYEASLAAKRLNYEFSRLKTCHETLKSGVTFIGELAKLCADVRLINPPGVLPNHNHELISPLEEEVLSSPGKS